MRVSISLNIQLDFKLDLFYRRTTPYPAFCRLLVIIVIKSYTISRDREKARRRCAHHENALILETSVKINQYTEATAKVTPLVFRAVTQVQNVQKLTNCARKCTFFTTTYLTRPGCILDQRDFWLKIIFQSAILNSAIEWLTQILVVQKINNQYLIYLRCIEELRSLLLR